MKRRMLVATAARLAAAWTAMPALAATPGVDAPPEPGLPRPIVVPPVHEARLPSGMQLLAVRRQGVPLVTATLLVRAGREADPHDRAGLAALTASLLSKGAQRGGRAVGAAELARQAEALGSVLDISTGWRAASVSMTVTTPKLPQALSLMADVVRRPTLSSDELERARTQLVDALRVSLSSPGDVATLVARRAYWGGSVHGGSPTPASVQRIGAAELRRFHASWYRPDRAVLVLAGDIDAERAEFLARERFGAWPANRMAVPVLSIDPARPLAAPLVIVEMPGSGQSSVVIAAPFVALSSPERRVAEVANTLLGGGYSARLNQAVRIRRGLSYGASSAGELQDVGGLVTASTQTNHPNAALVATLMREEMLLIGDQPTSAEELDARKATLVGSFARQMETTAGLAGLVAGQWFQGLPLAELSRYTEQVLAVTPDQVRDFARRTWTAASLRTVIATDVQAAGPSLGSLASSAAGVLRIPHAALDLEAVSLVAGPR